MPFRLSLFLIAHSLIHSFTHCAVAQTNASMQKQGLIDVQTVDPSVLVDLNYSTTDNFVKQDVYGDLTRAYLQPVVAQKLRRASQWLQVRRPDLRLLIYDAARPQSAQWKLWNALPQYAEKQRRTYVADPREGSIHSYGCAVDLTLATADGSALDMGTPYDFFGPKAYPKQEAQLLRSGTLTGQQVANRRLLRQAMQAGGFMPIDYEWWHFNALSRKQAKRQFKRVE